MGDSILGIFLVIREPREIFCLKGVRKSNIWVFIINCRTKYGWGYYFCFGECIFDCKFCNGKGFFDSLQFNSLKGRIEIGSLNVGPIIGYPWGDGRPCTIVLRAGITTLRLIRGYETAIWGGLNTINKNWVQMRNKEHRIIFKMYSNIIDWWLAAWFLV